MGYSTKVALHIFWNFFCQVKCPTCLCEPTSSKWAYLNVPIPWQTWRKKSNISGRKRRCQLGKTRRLESFRWQGPTSPLMCCKQKHWAFLSRISTSSAASAASALAWMFWKCPCFICERQTNVQIPSSCLKIAKEAVFDFAALKWRWNLEREKCTYRFIHLAKTCRWAFKYWELEQCVTPIYYVFHGFSCTEHHSLCDTVPDTQE